MWVECAFAELDYPMTEEADGQGKANILFHL